MEKIKNVLSGSKNDKNVATSDTTGVTTGQSPGLHSMTGEGSHLASNRENAGSGATSGLTGNQNTTGTGLGSTQNTGISSGTTTVGPHSSDLANKADPRVDLDLDGSRIVGNAGGVGNTTSGTIYDSSNVGNTSSTTGGYGASSIGNTGHSWPHQTEAANRLDPSVNTSEGPFETAHHHSKTHGGGAEEADTHHKSHVGRDAALGAGGVGLVEHERHKHQNERETGIGSTTTGSTGLGSSTGAYDNTTSSTTGATTGSATGNQSHVGRDVGIGATGVGAAGVAEHEHSKHSKGFASDLPGPAPNTAGPHKQDWLNKLDPRVNANPDQPQSTGHGALKVTEGQTGPSKPSDPNDGYTANPHHHRAADNNLDGSTTRHANPTHHGQSRANDSTEHDAAAVSALEEAGTYEAGRHHGVQSGIGGTSSTTRGGPHSSDLANKADPTVDSDRSKDRHYGRDAGIAGGVGAAVYEADKHHQKHETGVGGASSTATEGPYSSNLANKADPMVDSDRSKDHHYGRDTGVSGSVGAAAYEADKHHQKHDKNLTESERQAKKEHKHELKEERKEEKREHKESKGGLLSFLHCDKNKKYTPEEEAEFDRQEKEHNSHKGRDALGGATVGGAAYEAEKHHAHQQAATDKPLPTAPGNNGIGTGIGTQNVLAGGNTASATGTATGATPLTEKPPGTDLGDELHGIERNRGVPGPTGFPDQPGYGTGLTTGAGAGSGLDSGQTSGLTGSNQTHHHHGAEAGALGAGAGLAEHEHRKNERLTSGRHYDNINTSSGLTGSDTTASGPGSSNQGLGGSEYRKDDYVTGQQTGLPGNQSSGLTGTTGLVYDSNVIGSNTTGGIGGDRNKLHKDPPSDHPAAGGVPASGGERHDLVGQGEQRLDQDTGVGNAHGQSGINAASNY